MLVDFASISPSSALVDLAISWPSQFLDCKSLWRSSFHVLRSVISVQGGHRPMLGIALLLFLLLLSDAGRTSNWSSCLFQEIPGIVDFASPLLNCCLAYVSSVSICETSFSSSSSAHWSVFCVTWSQLHQIFWQCSPWTSLRTLCCLLPQLGHQHTCFV